MLYVGKLATYHTWQWLIQVLRPCSLNQLPSISAGSLFSNLQTRLWVCPLARHLLVWALLFVIPFVFYQQSEVCGLLSSTHISLKAWVSSGLGMLRSRISLRIWSGSCYNFLICHICCEWYEGLRQHRNSWKLTTNSHCLHCSQLYTNNLQYNDILPSNEDKEREKHNTQ